MAKEKKLRMSDDDLLDYVNSCYEESDRYYTQYIEPVIDECWDLYMVVRDYKDKKEWQSKNVSMRAFASVEAALAIVKRSLMGAKDFYTVLGQDRKDKQLEKVVKASVDYYLRKAKFYQKFTEALKSAFIQKFGVLKIYWRRWEEEVSGYDFKNVPPKFEYSETLGTQVMIEPARMERVETTKLLRKSELVIESIDPRNIRLDPWSKLNQKPKYIIEIERGVDFSTLKKLEEEGIYGEKAGGVSVDKIFTVEPSKETGQAATAEVPEMTLSQQGANTRAWVRETSASKDVQEEKTEKPKMDYRKPVDLIHLWGDLEAEKELEEGEKFHFYENYHVVIADGEFVIRKKKNPNTHGKNPYVIVPCILSPFRPYPISLVEPVRAALDYVDDMQNACLDALKFDIMKMWGVDVSGIDDPTADLVVEPGHFIKFSTGQPIAQSIQNLVSTTPGIPAAFNMIKWLDGQIQMGMGVVDPLMGMMVSGDTTATEYRGTLGQSTIKFMSIAQDIEEFAIAPAIEMIYQLILQNMDVNSGFFTEITSESGMPLQEYITPERISGNFDFYAKGITGYLHQLEYVSKMVSIFSTMVQAAPILQLSPQEARKVFKKIIKAQGVYDIEEDISDAPNIPQLVAQGGPPMKGGAEQPAQPPNPELGPENLMQMLSKGGGI